MRKSQLGFVTGIIFAMVAGLWFVYVAQAATGSLYLSPASQTVQTGSTFTVNLRVNPGANIDTVNGSVSYDAAKMSLVSIDCGGSPFTAFPSCPTGGNPINATAASLSGSVSGDSHVVKVTFKANVGSGSATVGLSGNTATAGTPNNPAVASASVSFKTPACASGQTGTWPNCTTPSAPSTPSTNPGTSSGGSSSTPPKKNSTTPSSPSSGGSSNTATPTPSTGTSATPSSTVSTAKVNVASGQVQYSKAALKVTSDQPVQVYISYGTDRQHYTNTPLSEFGTSHEVALDPSLLTPGKTYYYVVVAKDQQGKTTQTDVKTIKTKGLSVIVGVFDKDRKPIKNKTVTLHSDPYTAKTDSKGFATFTDVVPGAHHISYTAGKKKYSQEINVANTVQTLGATQTAAAQNIAVVLPVKESEPILIASLPYIGILIVLVGASFAYLKRDWLKARLVGANQPSTSNDFGTTFGPQSAYTSPTATTIPTSFPPATDAARPATLSEKLAALPDPPRPEPGTTITPPSEEERKQ